VHTAYRLRIPYTVHVAIGTDIIHQHPLADFSAIGWGSGQDFKIYTASVCDLEGGVFCNFGSSVIGPEVFLKALSIARNLGNPVRTFTTANFDLLPLADYRRPIGDDQTDYYYRPRKNIVNRPVSLGGKGFHICGDHRVTISNLHNQVLALLPEGWVPGKAREATPEKDPMQAELARSARRAAPCVGGPLGCPSLPGRHCRGACPSLSYPARVLYPWRHPVHRRQRWEHGRCPTHQRRTGQSL